MIIRDFQELRVFQLARESAGLIFAATRRFPAEERFSLTDQIRKSSRSVGANIAEAWRKRRYPSAFVSKLSDSDAESAETQAWLLFALDCGYVTRKYFDEMNGRYHHICAQLTLMMDHPEKWTAQMSRSRKALDTERIAERD